MFKIIKRILAIITIALAPSTLTLCYAQQYVGNTQVVRLDTLATKKDSLSKAAYASVTIDPKNAKMFETLSNLTDEQYDALVIPPLDVLLSRYGNSGSVKSMQGQIDNARLELISIRRQWLSWLGVHANYSYGNSDMYAIQYLETTYPIWNYNNSKQQTSFWNVGATLSIPLSDIFNYRTDIRKQKAQISALEGQRQQYVDEWKIKVIDLYIRAVQNLSVFKTNAENLAAADAQYTISENDFLNGAISVHDLFIMKNYQSGAKLSYESCKAQLNEVLLSLEVYTGLPIVSEMKSAILGQPEEPEEEENTSHSKAAKNKKSKKTSNKSNR